MPNQQSAVDRCIDEKTAKLAKLNISDPERVRKICELKANVRGEMGSSANPGEAVERAKDPATKGAVRDYAAGVINRAKDPDVREAVRNHAADVIKRAKRSRR